MKTFLVSLLTLLCLYSVKLTSQNAPITKAGIVVDATTVPGSVIVPVSVSNFVSIGSFTLTLRYKANLVNYVSATAHSSFPGITITNTVDGIFGKIVIYWPETPGGVTLPDETHLADLTFTYISSTSYLNWYYTSPNVCEYKKYSNGSYILLNNLPRSTYYINGGISNRGAPLTSVPIIDDPLPGNLAIPVTVNNFNAISAMTLNLEYNQDVLSFQSCVKNPLLTGYFSAATQLGSNGKRRVVISWTSPSNLTLPDESTVVTINFIYSNTAGNYSGLDWYEIGPSCEYADATGIALLDAPTANYYTRGAVYTQFSPKTWLPVISNAVPSNALSLPLFVNDFNNVRSFNLTFEYDPAVMIYNSFIPDTAFGDALIVLDSPSDTKRKIELSWTGSISKTLPEGSQIADLNFNYVSGVSELNWITDDGTSCRFNDDNGNAYYDIPKAIYYKNGLLASHVSPHTIAGNITATAGSQVSIPISVYDFSNIGTLNLALKFDPDILTYTGATFLQSVGGTFNASTEGTGMLNMEWSGPAASLPDSTELMGLTFTYNGGSSTLEWYDNGNSSKYEDGTSGAELYDQPSSFYYINGYVGPDPLIADFALGTPFRSYDTLIYLTDLSSGNPTTWNWTISPSSYYFTNGTTASSQNPEVKFTSNGAYTVILIVNRGTNAGIKIRTDYLFIGTPGLWTGHTSGDWNVGSNWHNFKVPDSSLNIVIPETATNWPHLSGSLTIGQLCENVTMDGASQLFVDGNLTINSGTSFVFTGSGALFLGGNWSNSGTFVSGTGTVEFNGPGDSYILGDTSTKTFYRINVSKTNANVYIQGTVHVTGTDNP